MVSWCKHLWSSTVRFSCICVSSPSRCNHLHTSQRQHCWNLWVWVALSRWRDFLWYQKPHHHKKRASLKMSSFHERVFLVTQLCFNCFPHLQSALKSSSYLTGPMWELIREKQVHTHTHPLMRIHWTQNFYFSQNELIPYRKSHCP